MKAVFLDRDGTVIVDPPDLRVDSVDDIKLFDDTIEALTELAKLDYAVFMVTNQAGIAEGRLTEAEFNQINTSVVERLVPSGITIVKTYMCPHAEAASCECRKPKPTMLQWAANEYDLDLSESYIIGDRQTDIMTGVNAGTKTILVQTGNVPVTSKEADYTAPDLSAAVRYIKEQTGHRQLGT